jgi:alkyl hydroperoxide reductase subunit AhpC
MLPAETGDSSPGRTAADNATLRSVFVISPDKTIKAMLTYPMSTGRSFDEVLRLLDPCQLTASLAPGMPSKLRVLASQACQACLLLHR